MSDLDKAIRADLAQRARETAPEAADRSMVAYADAIRSVLDLHAHTEVPGLPMRQCAACGLVSRGRWCDTVSAIADDLGVSGKDRSEPTPAPREPRVWRHGVHANIDADVTEVVGGRSNVLYTREPRTQFMWRGQKSSGVGFVYGVASLLADEGHVTEVVTPEGTS